MDIKSVYQITMMNDKVYAIDKYEYRIPDVGNININVIYIDNDSDKIEHAYAIVNGYPSNTDYIFLDIFINEKDKFMKRDIIIEQPDARYTFLHRIADYILYGNTTFKDDEREIDKIKSILKKYNYFKYANDEGFDSIVRTIFYVFMEMKRNGRDEE